MANKWNKLLGAGFKIDSKGFSRCLEPTLTCMQKAIKAHSIQNARILEALATDGHIISLTRRMDREKGPQVDFGLVGRNLSTTFTGFCAKHDRDIFYPIEKNELDIDDPFHLFLIAYRAVTRELHATMEGAYKLQKAILKRVELGIDPINQHNAAGEIAVGHMIKAHNTWLYRTSFDTALLKKSYENILHDIIVLDVERPLIAVCSLFSLEDYVIEDSKLHISLNVLPLSETSTVVVFSYRKSDIAIAKEALGRILYSNGMQQRYELSRLILNSCENFVICPDHFDSWSEEKKEEIKSFYLNTIYGSNLSYESEHLYMF
jgi:hypothetical protein